MSSSAYVALSAQMATERRLSTVANNIANANTAGFRAEHIRFETLVSQA
ncbi:MAG: flagellar basal body protein, partial [Pseudomonadota bacterium]